MLALSRARAACLLLFAEVLIAPTLVPAIAAEAEPAAAVEAAEAAPAEATAEPALSPAEQKSAAAWRAAQDAMVSGPASVPLRDQAKIDVPDGYAYVPVKEGKALMEVMGNSIDERFLGLIFPLAEEARWFVTLDYEESGYVKDDDAKEWDADELLQSLKDGTEAGNERREAAGFPPLKVTRWVEKPAYDATTHRLVWSAEAKLRDEDDPDPSINVNTYLLGREGYISLNLITSASSVEADKPAAKQLLKAVAFNEGKRYADFVPGSDRVAEYGLAALVGGIAAKKLGLLAAAAAFFAKFAKLIFIGVAAFGAGIVKWWKGRTAGNA
jgi:uncharacterized membrane-anchored protein